MISPKVLSTAAVMALVLPMAAPTASFAQSPPGRGAVLAAPAFPWAVAVAAAFTSAVAAFPVAIAAAAPPVAGIGGGGGGGGGGWHGGYGGGYRHGGGGFIPGAVAGAVIGGAIVSQGYYGGPGYYYAPGYYDDQYYDEGPVEVAPAPAGDDAVAYCMQTYRSYDPASGTYLGYDGYRHPCP